MTFEPWHWFVFGVILMIAEMFVPTFFLLWFGAAAVVVALLLVFVPLTLTISVVAWLVLSAILCVAWFKFIQPTFKNRTKAGLGAVTIIGETGMIIKAPNETNAGVIRFATPKAGASEWACRSQNNTLCVGDKAVILDIVGNELLVGKN